MKTGSVMLAISALAFFLQISAFGQDEYLLGIARMNDGSPEQARIHFENVLATDGDDQDCLLKISETFYRTHDYHNAIEYLERLEKLQGGMGSYLLAKTYAELGDASMSVFHLEKHLRSPYKLPSSTILLDDAFLSLEQGSEWKSLWKNDWYSEEEVLFQEISYLSGAGDYIDALDMIETAIGGPADQVALLAARGKVFYRMENYQNSVEAYTEAIEKTRMNAECFYGRAESYIALGKIKNALPDLKRAWQLQPEKLELLKELSQANRSAGIFDQAAAAIEEYIEYFPAQAEAHYVHGQILFDSGKYLQALSSFNTCLELETNDPRFYAARGQTYLATSTYRYALNDFGMALDLDPKNHEVWFQKGMARWNSNDREGSINDWQIAARLGSQKAAEKLEELSIRQ